MIKIFKNMYQKCMNNIITEYGEEWESYSKIKQFSIKAIFAAITVPLGIASVIVGKIAGELVARDLANKGYAGTEEWQIYWEQVVTETYSEVEGFWDAFNMKKLIKKIRERMVDRVIYHYYRVE